jgi:alkylation response protein AidB-like acyl-CoA dehydrogenase
VITAKKGKDVGLALVDLTGPGVQRRTLKSLDPSRSLAEIRFDAAAAEPLGETAAGWDAVRHLLDRAAVLMAFEQLGGAQRAFDMTREYCLERYAFGRAIASFQAVKHRLADLYVELELGKSNAYYGAWALSHESKDLPVAACGARASASSAFELATTEMIQLYGGVGYTWEFDCHLFYRRAKFLSASLGGVQEWRDRLVSLLAA